MGAGAASGGSHRLGGDGYRAAAARPSLARAGVNATVRPLLIELGLPGLSSGSPDAILDAASKVLREVLPPASRSGAPPRRGRPLEDAPLMGLGDAEPEL